MKTNIRLVFSILLFLICFSSFAQVTPELWKREFGQIPRTTPSGESLEEGKGRKYALNENKLREALRALESGSQVETIILFPDSEGNLQPFVVREQSVMRSDLQERFPQIRSYSGVCTLDPALRIRFSMSHKGLQLTLADAVSQKRIFIEKIRGTSGKYLQFSRDEQVAGSASWLCKTTVASDKSNLDFGPMQLIQDRVLRRYRLAVAASGEYTQYHGGTIEDALAAINATVTRINEVFERELAVSLELIATTDAVIFTDPQTDPFTSNLNAEVQSTLTNVIGSDFYDIGHLFHSDGENGNAGYIGSVCKNNQKGSAYASSPIPEGDRFDLDFVAHEMGHQFGANHTWSFESEGTGVQAEPASGTTIMGYAGIIPGNNVAMVGDDYFHYYSLAQIAAYLSGLTCGEVVPLVNTPPVVLPSEDYFIPRGTPFVLTGNASDSDVSDFLTYAWEQIDDGVVTTASFGPENPSGANFRSRRPVVLNRRYFPAITEVLAGNLTQIEPPTGSAWETVSNIARDLSFALTVRDNGVGGGQMDSDEMQVHVRYNAGPFKINSQSTPQTYLGGSVQEITWDVAGTNSGDIQAQEVDVYMDLDGTHDFLTLLAVGLPNTGTAKVQMPGTATANGRILVKPSDNIFFAVNAVNITLIEQPFILEAPHLELTTCLPESTTTNLLFKTYSGFNATVNLELSGLPSGMSYTLDQTQVQADQTSVQLILDATGPVLPGKYTLVVTATSDTTVFELPIELLVADGNFAETALVFPLNGALNIELNPTLEWQADPSATAYAIEISTNSGFTEIFRQQQVYSNTYTPGNLAPNTDYFWRVRAVNDCGSGSFSAVSQFRTLGTECKILSATALPLPISAIGTSTVATSVTYAEDLPVADIRVNLDISHTYLADLTITLTSPSGTQVTLLANSCGRYNDIQALFADDALPFECGNSPAISGIVRPLGQLSSFAGESSLGTWTLTVADNAAGDGGQINAFGLELCVAGSFRPDADNDGVFDDGDDLCLGTPPGQEVDASGCSIYRFQSDHFSLTLDGESCIDAADGQLQIDPIREMAYTLTISGPELQLTDQFTTNYTLAGLSAGTYEVCLEGSENDIVYQQRCYSVQVISPPPLSVVAEQSDNGSEVTLEVSGTLAYRVSINNEPTIATSGTIALKLQPGINRIQVTGIPACLGTFETLLFYSQDPVVAPNPFDSGVRIMVPEIGKHFEIVLFNSAGSVIYSRDWVPETREVELNLPNLSTGWYLLRMRQGAHEVLVKLYRR
jgi:subtilisin-like proprotein convertase family protein